MDRPTKQYIEKQLEDYPKLDEYIRQRRLELKYPQQPKDDNIDAPRGTGIGNPTERMVLTIDSDKRLNQLEKTKQAIDKVLDQLDEKSYMLVELKYWKKPQTLTWTGIAIEIGYSRSQTFRIRDSIVEMVGTELGFH